MDSMSPDARRRTMQAVRSKNTTPEMRVRRRAHALGLRFRLHRKDLPGTPDLAFPGRRTVVFVHGCFWHGHEGCRRGSLPSSNVEFWNAKLTKNRKRDAAALEELAALRWRAIVVWECETRSCDLIDARLAPLLASHQR